MAAKLESTGPLTGEDKGQRSTLQLRTVTEFLGHLTVIDGKPIGFGLGFAESAPATVFGDHAQIIATFLLPAESMFSEMGGHWPAPLYVKGGGGPVAGEDFIRLYNGTRWWEPRFVTSEEGYAGAFPWRERSILAYWQPDPDYESGRAPRLGVIVGEPKGPKLDGFRLATSCRPFSIDSIAVDPKGPVTAIIRCKSKYWIVDWPTLDDGEVFFQFALDMHVLERLHICRQLSSICQNARSNRLPRLREHSRHPDHPRAGLL